MSRSNHWAYVFGGYVPADEDSKAAAIEAVPDRALEAFKAGGDYISILREEHEKMKKEMAAAAKRRAATDRNGGSRDCET